MAEEGSAEGNRRLSDTKRDLLDAIARGLWELPRLARSGGNLIAIGEALEALEALGEGGEIEVAIDLDVGFRRGDRTFQEGQFICFQITEDEIVLNELHTSYTTETGSDWFTETYATLLTHRYFDDEAIHRRLEALDHTLAEGDATLRATRTMSDNAPPAGPNWHWLPSA